MSKYKSEFEYILSEDLDYQNQMGEKKTDKLIFIAPSNNQRSFFIKLRQSIVQAFMAMGAKFQNSNQQESNSKPTDKQLERDDILPILYGSDLDLEKFQETFWSMILDKRCYVGEKVNNIFITQDLLNDVGNNDKDKILGEYIVNFILPSWMQPKPQK